jgi:hypothetical protein
LPVDSLQVSSKSRSKKKNKKNDSDSLQVSSTSHSKKKKKKNDINSDSDSLQVSSKSHSKKKKKAKIDPDTNPLQVSSTSHSKKKKKAKIDPDTNPLQVSSKSHSKIKPEVTQLTSQAKTNRNEDTLSKSSNLINNSRHPFENRTPPPHTQSTIYKQDFALKRLYPDDIDYHSSIDPRVDYQANKSNNINIHRYQNDHRKVPQETESVIFPSREPAVKTVKKPKQKPNSLQESEHKKIKADKTRLRNQVYHKHTDVVKKTEIPKAGESSFSLKSSPLEQVEI